MKKTLSFKGEYPFLTLVFERDFICGNLSMDEESKEAIFESFRTVTVFASLTGGYALYSYWLVFWKERAFLVRGLFGEWI